MGLSEVLRDLRGDDGFMACVAAWRTLPAQEARYAALPDEIDPTLRHALEERGMARLYTHQAAAVAAALEGGNPLGAVAVVTPTASGKTLCYNLPVFHKLLQDGEARALYLFPTKALAHDQLNELHEWTRRLNLPPTTVAAYDGDTPSAERTRIRKQARILLTNPDMLHTGILPYHANWADFLGGLRYVVLDEMHTYRGVFGSHVANVLRRLRRLCAFHGDMERTGPRFICTSATIANPGELAERLTEAASGSNGGQPVTVIDENGAPRGEKHIILYNPPLYDAKRGLRRSSILEAQELAARCVLGGVQTIVFGRSRLTTELLLGYLRERVERTKNGRYHTAPTTPAAGQRAVQQTVRGYRGGYLPSERRAIEAGLRSGDVRAVVATNALELGIDIGQLQAALLCGYPGTIAGTWQQMGRAGRTTRTSHGASHGEAALAILVATGGALDQYVIRHPEFIFERSPEHALINPDNPLLLIDQMRCAAFELPFAPGEGFGNSPDAAVVLEFLAEQGDVQMQRGSAFWAGDAYPSRGVSLRSTGGDTVAIQQGVGSGEWGVGSRGQEAGGIPASRSSLPASTEGPVVIGEIDRPSAPLLLHPGAVYWHEGQSFLVESLDLDQHLALVRAQEVDFYTEVISEATVEVLGERERRLVRSALAAHGDLQVSIQPAGYRRIKRFTHETLGVFPLEYPPDVLETTGYWLSVPAETQAALEQAGSWYDSLNDYGPNWEEQRQRVRARDNYRCTQCGAPEPPGRQHDVHHLVPFRTFGYVPGLNENYRAANRTENLALVCRTCHRRLESGVRVRSGMDGLAYALGNLAPLYLMCDPQDIAVHVERTAPRPEGSRQTRTGVHAAADSEQETRLPRLFIYERTVAGLGFSARLYEQHEELLAAAGELIRQCACSQGCPACVGPILDEGPVQLDTKRLALALVDALSARSPVPVTEVRPAGPGEDVDFGMR